jgi:hypothetical protein
VTDSWAVQAMVEIEHSGNTIKGKLAIEDAPATEFYGWLELIDRLERAASTQTAPDQRAPPAEDQPR